MTTSDNLDIRVDSEACMGSGNCEFTAPTVFRLDDTGIARVIDAHAPVSDHVRMAARQCPTGAIEIRHLGSAD
ncbi:hypothetical protein AU184_26335 [Mycolicibacterium novocastrense]|uniref:ferredoxin n=1 Tax=Mycolicibacterium novocastrense TaxID=59813 RepID=UPI000747D3FB|nr:ferredoxin [Mycolicibacterium novocastrense]KUH67471.1 hypothetical protein AU183_00070 [Mycolicibacterium novocastrense]KUH68191.1 hypothetical protein AU184_26335 [Mycolicibacterium novocastrense]